MRQYIGARYVPKIYTNSLDPTSSEWESGVTYEPLTVVDYNYSSYIARIPVPGSVGAPPANPTYWAVAGAYNGQIANLQNQINALGSAPKAIKTFEDYGAKGDGVTDDTAAIKAALTDAEANGYILTSLRGTYLISDDLVIDGITLLEFGTVKAISSNTVTIHQHSVVKYGAFEKINIIANGYYVDLSNITINDYVGVGLAISNISTNTSYDRHGMVAFEHIRCNNMDKDGISNVGFDINCPDVYLDYCESINNGIGFRIKAQCCHIAHSTGWLNGNTTLTGSKCFRLEASAFELLSCTSDTMETGISLITQYLNGSVTDFLFLVNNAHFQNSAFKFMDTFGGVYGNAVLKLTGMSAASNTMYIGSAGHMNIELFDGSVSDYPLLISGNNIFTPNGFTATFSNNCKYWRDANNYHLKLQFEVTSGSFLIGDSHTITPAYRLPDYAGMVCSAYPIDVIYHASGVPYSAGKALLSIANDGTITIQPYFYETSADYLLMVNADIVIPIPQDHIS